MLIRMSIFLILMTVLQSVYAIETPSPTARFISVADIHFDPFSDCSSRSCPVLKELEKTSYQNWPQIFEKYGSKRTADAGEDTNYALFKNLLIQLKKTSATDHPVFVLILGDFLAHDFRDQYRTYSVIKTQAGYEKFVNKTMQFIVYEFNSVFPSIDVYPVVGNNDTYNEDYYSIPRGRFFKDMTSTWGTLIKNKNNLKNFNQNFPFMGYYEVTLPFDVKDKIVILNTVVFSTNPGNQIHSSNASKELAWLHNQLNTIAAKHQHALLAYHIPVGIDLIATLKSNFHQITALWQPVYSTQFENELRQFTPDITAILVGHLHVDVFTSMTLKKFAGIHEYVTPSVSPIFGNSSSFKIISYDPQTLRLKKIDSVMID